MGHSPGGCDRRTVKLTLSAWDGSNVRAAFFDLEVGRALLSPKRNAPDCPVGCHRPMPGARCSPQLDPYRVWFMHPMDGLEEEGG